jgi:hypothetical protein
MALAKAALLRIGIEEKQRKLVRQDDVNELIDRSLASPSRICPA